ncbi:hypothetical protein OAU13_00115 [bacterium]|nr:hypothetical protein [bacterium]
MATTAKIARTDVPGEVPNTSNSSNTSYIEPGALFINVTDQLLYSSNGTNYFVVGGGGGGSANVSVLSQTFSGNGSNTDFTLTQSANTSRTFVFLNGVAQAPTTDFTVTGSTLSFTTAPTSIDTIHVHVVDLGSPNDVEFTFDSFVGNDSNTQFTLSSSLASNSYALVFLNGVAQVPTTDYGVSGTILTFTTAPTSIDNIEVISINAADNLMTTTFTGNGSNKTFTLTDPSTTNKTFVYLNGVAQVPIDDYYVTNKTLTFVTAPANNDTVVVRTFFNRVDASGTNTFVQFNDSGDISASPGFTFDKTTNNVVIANTLDVATVRFTASNPPGSAGATGVAGTIAWDSSYIYVCVATNTWKRVQIATWP